MLLALVATAPAATTAGLLVASGIPYANWHRLPNPPVPALGLAGPTCYEVGTAAAYIRTAGGKFYRYRTDHPEWGWVLADSVPTTTDPVSGPCNRPIGGRDQSPPRVDTRTLTITEVGADCGGRVQYALKAGSELWESATGSCAIGDVAIWIGACLLSVPVAVLLWIAVGLRRWRANAAG